MIVAGSRHYGEANPACDLQPSAPAWQLLEEIGPHEPDEARSWEAPQQAAELSRKPSEYFKDHWYSTFWFEDNFGDLQYLIDKVGEDNVMFETDFPHPTCMYPDPLGTIEPRMSALRPQTRRKVLGENAAKLYRLG